MNGIIKPGVQLGNFYIGTKKEDIAISIKEEYIVRDLGDGFCKIMVDNYILWFDSDEALSQIGVTKGFLDGYNNIHIGSTMQDVINIYGAFENDDVEYLIPNVGGICFELEDVDDWDELTAPIEWIFVYKC